MAAEPKRHRIQVACPECGHLQMEPTLVVSSQCRSCRLNFKVIDGKAVADARAVKPFTATWKEKEPEEDQASAKDPKPPLLVKTAPPAKRSILRRIFDPVQPQREVTCFDCYHPFIALSAAESSQCPKCGRYVSLQNFTIHQAWNRHIQTRGDVVISKTGSITGATIRCHHLTVLGKLSGTVECSGDLIIRSHGKIIGAVRCQNLRIQKGAHVEFLHPVTAETVVIDGQVHGQISCSGSVTLEKRAELHGLVRTSSLIVKAGAKHSGKIEMTPTHSSH